VWLLPHAYTDETSSLLSLCTSIITYVLLRGRPLFMPTTPLSSFRKRPTLKYNKSVSEPDLRSSQVIRHLAALDLLHHPTPQKVLRDPWLTYHHHHHHHHRHVIPRRSLSILRQSWSPRAKCHSALTGIRAPNRLSYFAATVTRSSTQSSGG